MKKNYLIIFPLLLALLILVPRTFAAPSNNPIFVTIEIMQQMISNALTPINNLLDSHDQRIAELESNVQGLETRIDLLEATPTPTITPTPIVTPTPDLRPFEASLTREGDKFTIVSNKIITDCRYTSESPSGNLKVTGSSNLANGTTACEVILLNAGWSYTITVKDETGDTKSFSGTV